MNRLLLVIRIQSLKKSKIDKIYFRYQKNSEGKKKTENLKILY